MGKNQPWERIPINADKLSSSARLKLQSGVQHAFRASSNEVAMVDVDIIAADLGGIAAGTDQVDWLSLEVGDCFAFIK